jgi:hypothetical protein
MRVSKDGHDIYQRELTSIKCTAGDWRAIALVCGRIARTQTRAVCARDIKASRTRHQRPAIVPSACAGLNGALVARARNLANAIRRAKFPGGTKSGLTTRRDDTPAPIRDVDTFT